MNVHRRQFMLGPSPVDFIPGCVTTQIAGVGYLSHCPELRVASVKNVEGKIWHLLGTAVQTDTSRLRPIDELAHATSSTVEGMYHTWAGRWVLIGDGRLYLDASGLSSCFYGFKETIGDGKELLASSSLGLLVGLLETNPCPVRSIQHQKGMDWYAGPRSRFDSARQLLPSQILELKTGDIFPRQLLPKTTDNPSYDDLLDVLQNYLVTAVTQASNLSGNLMLPLTAGYDSRLLLATLSYAGIPATTYTHIHKHMSPADTLLPPELANAVGFKHVAYPGMEYRSDLADLCHLHTNGNCVDRDRYYISHQYFNWCRKGDLILRSGGSEIGRCFYWRKFPEPHTSSILPSSEVILHGFEKDPHPSLAQTIDEWVVWSKETGCDRLDWRDRLYLEQRLGCWLSAVEQLLDLIDADRFHSFNSHSYFSRVLQVPAAKRQLKQHHVDLIKRMAPALAKFPFNALNTGKSTFAHRILTAVRPWLPSFSTRGR
jgi:hypothetical protein